MIEFKSRQVVKFNELDVLVGIVRKLSMVFALPFLLRKNKKYYSQATTI